MSFPAPTSYHHDPTPATDPTQKHLSASGKAVLVTGGGTTIGKAIAEAFAKARAKTVFLTGRRLHLLDDVAKKLSGEYPQTTFVPVQADIAKETDVQQLFQVISKSGTLDILVANAGYLPTPGPLKDSETSEWWAGFEINVLGTYLLAKAFLNQPQPPTEAPVFISVNTGVAHLGPAAGPVSGYGASKLAGASVVEFLQAENPDLKAFSVSPGVVQSDMADKARSLNFEPTDSPELMANLAVWLASSESDFLKGRFLWANWDVEELVKAKEKLASAPGLLRLTLEGWSSGFAELK